MPLQLGALRDALPEAGATPEKANKAAEELARYENRFDGLENKLTAFEGRMDSRLAAFEGRMNALEERVNARFNLQGWRIGFVMAVQLILLGLVLRIPVH